MTSNPSAVVDEAAFSVTRSLDIAAPVDKVWQAVTEPQYISRWFGRADFEGTAVGSAGTLTWDGRDPIPVRIEAVDAPRSISYRWSNDDALGTSPEALDPEHSTMFTFTLEPAEGGTRLTVVETGFDALSDPASDMASHSLGWTSELDKLVALVEAAA